VEHSIVVVVVYPAVGTSAYWKCLGHTRLNGSAYHPISLRLDKLQWTISTLLPSSFSIVKAHFIPNSRGCDRRLNRFAGRPVDQFAVATKVGKALRNGSIFYIFY